MQPIMEYKGSDIDEAVNNACVALGVRREELAIEVVSTGSAGIFGLGRKKAVVRVALRDQGRGREEGAPVAPAVAVGSSQAAPKTKPIKPAKPAPIAEVREARGEEGEVLGEPLTPAELVEIRELVSRLLTLAGLALEVKVAQESVSHKVLVDLAGPGQEALLGSEGDTLEALQYLFRKMVGKQSPKRITLELDAGGFRQQRRDDLTRRALALAAEVKATGRGQTMPASNPAERRIIHLALQDDPEIVSRSVGEGVFKKVLIHLPGKGRKKIPRHRAGGRPAAGSGRGSRPTGQS